ncbi:hypothetical protein I3842_06G087800 [Carya illinoinensis]|uniref:Uncharacterized protein n=2 Tax=Carya illinoinensis TaxID=32201 RepID=A0A922JKI4_CARIL|nr:hypothetical protein I3842_06G087800 [Carya illinoinensis]
MAMKMVAMLRSAGGNMGYTLGLRRLSHIMAFPPPLEGVVDRGVTSQPFVLPEFYRDRDDDDNINSIGFEFPNFTSAGSMELMAVPKRKVSPHKRGIRNGPKALKPIPVIIRCKGCGRVKLPHFYCCSGNRGSVDEQNDATR